MELNRCEWCKEPYDTHTDTQLELCGLLLHQTALESLSRHHPENDYLVQRLADIDLEIMARNDQLVACALQRLRGVGGQNL